MESIQNTGELYKTERNYGIDALRLVLMYMVCLLHTLGMGGVLAASTEGTVEYKVYWFIEILSFCAVDAFALISGYTATNKPRNYSKIIEMWFQVFFYSFLLTGFLAYLLPNCNLTKMELIKAAFPVTFEKFWYFSAYFVLFFAMPFLNKYIFSIDEATAKKALIIAVIMFSFLGIVADPFKLEYGYSALWIIVLYCIGALSKIAKLFEEKRSFTLILLWAASVMITWAARMYLGISRITNYVSPTILLNGMIMVVLFSRLKLKGTVISKLAPLAFGIYLFQLSQIIWNNVLRDAATFVVTKNIFIGVLYVIIFASAIWVSGLIVEFIRTKLFRLLHVSEISKRTVNMLDKAMTKLFVVLK